MKTALPISSPGHRSARGFLMNEALIYIGLVFVVLAVGYLAVYRSIDQSTVLRQNASDISSAIAAGEHWRADVRGCRQAPRLATESGKTTLVLQCSAKRVEYTFENGAVQRRIDGGAWSTVLDHVAASAMASEDRAGVTAWKWDLELQPRRHGSVAPSRVRPLFTFLAVPPSR